MRVSTVLGGAARAILIAVVLLASGPALADHAMEMKARESFAAGRYEDAIDLFAKLYAETLHPVYLRNIGRCHQKMREPQKAIDAFRDYLVKSKKMPASERQEIEAYIREMQELSDEQARAQKAAPTPTATATATATPTPPAPPTPTPTAPPTVAQLAAPTPPPGPTASLVAAPAQPASSASSPIYARWWFWTGIAVVAAGGVAAALLIPGGTTKPPCPAEALGNCK